MPDRIYKYELQVVEEQMLYMPENARILHIAVRDQIPYLWAQVSTEAVHKPRVFRFVTTGDTFDPGGMFYIDTLLWDKQGIIVHIYEKIQGVGRDRSMDTHRVKADLEALA